MLSSSNDKGTIVQIQRFCIHDGPGIRTTVFLKGCPLRCLWCSNPETQKSTPELMYYYWKCQKDCNACIEVCPNGAIKKEEEKILIDKLKCNECFACVNVCRFGALRVVGEVKSSKQVLEVVLKDKKFYKMSGGGVTLSGGEPLLQAKFSNQIMTLLKQNGIHVVLDTSGYGKWEDLCILSNYADQIFYDIKHMNGKKHMEFTGVDNIIILENFKRLLEKRSNNSDIIIRFPLVPGLNDDEENLVLLGKFASQFGVMVQVLPYHRYGVKKYEQLGRTYLLNDVQTPKHEYLETVLSILQDTGGNAEICE